jgi:hypothetical protein
MRWLRSVVIDDFDDDDGRNSRPVETTILSARRWVSRFEDKSTRVIEIDGKLPQAWPLEFVAPRCR